MESLAMDEEGERSQRAVESKSGSRWLAACFSNRLRSSGNI